MKKFILGITTACVCAIAVLGAIAPISLIVAPNYSVQFFQKLHENAGLNDPSLWNR